MPSAISPPKSRPSVGGLWPFLALLLDFIFAGRKTPQQPLPFLGVDGRVDVVWEGIGPPEGMGIVTKSCVPTFNTLPRLKSLLRTRGFQSLSATYCRITAPAVEQHPKTQGEIWTKDSSFFHEVPWHISIVSLMVPPPSVVLISQ